jgi:NitT/TauT family transport system substrate-binding protein
MLFARSGGFITNQWGRSMTVRAKFLAGTLAVAIVGFGGAAQANDKIVLGTNWLAQAEHGGYYQAKAEGYYEAAGLDVSIKMGGPQVNTAQLLIAGALDFAMISNSFIPINMVKENIPFIAVASMFQKDPQILMAHKELGLKTLADVKGRPTAISTDAVDTYWKFLKVAFGFTDDQIRPYSFSVAPFLVEKSLIQQGYLTNEPFRAKEAGVDPQVFLLADFGYSSYSELLMCSKKMVTEHPDVVKRFVEASIKGYATFLHGPHDKALALIKKDNPDYTDKAAAEAIEAMNGSGLLESGSAQTLGIGSMTDERWKDFFDTMVKAGVYPQSLDYKSSYTLQFVNQKVGK